MNNRKKTFLDTFALTPSNRFTLEFETRIQLYSRRWHKERRNHLNSSSRQMIIWPSVIVCNTFFSILHSGFQIYFLYEIMFSGKNIFLSTVFNRKHMPTITY